MILELADIRIHPGQNAAFDAAIVQGVRDVISHSKGFQGCPMHSPSGARW